jgi:hypothetical protein
LKLRNHPDPVLCLSLTDYFSKAESFAANPRTPAIKSSNGVQSPRGLASEESLLPGFNTPLALIKAETFLRCPDYAKMEQRPHWARSPVLTAILVTATQAQFQLKLTSSMNANLGFGLN